MACGTCNACMSKQQKVRWHLGYTKGTQRSAYQHPLAVRKLSSQQQRISILVHSQGQQAAEQPAQIAAGSRFAGGSCTLCRTVQQGMLCTAGTAHRCCPGPVAIDVTMYLGAVVAVIIVTVIAVCCLVILLLVIVAIAQVSKRLCWGSIQVVLLMYIVHSKCTLCTAWLFTLQRKQAPRSCSTEEAWRRPQCAAR
jgi:hypothetical protein